MSEWMNKWMNERMTEWGKKLEKLYGISKQTKKHVELKIKNGKKKRLSSIKLTEGK